MADVKALLKELTLEEKASLCSGKSFWTTKAVERLNIPYVMMTDGPHGLRKEIGAEGGGVNIMKGSEPATCFPPAVTTASSWDRPLLRRIGEAIAEEAINLGVSTVLGPGTNIKRSPLCGRNFEYFSEDPYLAGELSTNYVSGMQEKGVGTSLKHYCGNNQEYLRMSCDSKIDERALREIYLPAFEQTVKRAQPMQIMCSYNLLNGTYLSDNKRMLTDVLRDEWGYKGIVVSDWGAVNNRVDGVKAGMDLEMPGNGGMNDRQIIKAVNEGALSMEELDTVVERVLNYVFTCVDNKRTDKYDLASHHELCREAAANAAVLLKNEGLLPLTNGESIAVIGKLAQEVRYQGSGSSRINPIKVSNVLDELTAAGVNYEYAEGYTLDRDGYDKKLLVAALELAQKKDKIVVFIGLTDVYESEGFDRSHMDLPLGHNKLMIELLKLGKKVVVVLQGGSPVSMPWANEVGAILNTYLGGEAVAEATVDVLTGKVNPSGKLAETFPIKYEDVLAGKYYQMGPRTVEYRESIYVGYRYFDTADKQVLFPFGYGLSYTTFKYSDLKAKADYTEGGKYTLSFKLTNTGAVDGAEIAQIYVRQKDSPVFKADKELKGFEKVFLKAGESKTVSIDLDARSFAFYNTAINDWHVLSGEYEVLVGSSSRDIKLTQSVKVTSLNPDAALPDYRNTAAVYYDIKGATEISKEQFEGLYGEALTDNSPFKRGEFTVNSTVLDISVTGFGNFIKKVMTFAGKIIASDAANKAMIVNSIQSMPLRALSGFSGGILTNMSVNGLVDVFNKKKGGWGKFFAGFKKCNR